MKSAIQKKSDEENLASSRLPAFSEEEKKMIKGRPIGSFIKIDIVKSILRLQDVSLGKSGCLDVVEMQSGFFLNG